MDSDINLKINKTLTNSHQIAVVLPEQVSIDLISAALAIYKKLVNDGKQVTIFSSGPNIPKQEFIANQPIIRSNFGSAQELTIKVNGQSVKPKQIRYEKLHDDLFVYVTPEESSKQFTSDDVEVIPAVTSYDLLVILGADTLESIGKLYETNTELFFNTTKIAISNKLDQEYFGTITWVESDTPSISQQIAEWLLKDDQNILKDDFVATSLLTGIISATQSFSDPRTTPDSLAIAAKLVSNGARRGDVIKYLYKTKPFNLLQLWGRALARIKTFQNNSILYTVITAQDFAKTQTDSSYLAQVLSEIISMANNYQLIILSAESPTGVELLFAAPPHVKIKKIARTIDPTFAGDGQPLIGNYRYLSLQLPNFKPEDLESMVSTLSSTGI